VKNGAVRFEANRLHFLQRFDYCMLNEVISAFLCIITKQTPEIPKNCKAFMLKQKGKCDKINKNNKNKLDNLYTINIVYSIFRIPLFSTKENQTANKHLDFFS